MKLEFSLSQLEANRVDQLKWNRLPRLRYMYFWLTLPLTFFGSAAAYLLNDDFSGIVMAVSMWLFIPMLTWYVLTVKRSPFSDATAGGIVSGGTVSYSYEITGDALIGLVDGVERKLLLSDILDHSFENGELRIRTESDIVTIPAGSVSPSKIGDFSNRLSESVIAQ